MSEFKASSFEPTPLRKPKVPPLYTVVDEDMKKFIKDSEGPLRYFYKDTKGKVTIGYGQMIPSLDAAKNLPLYSFSGVNPLRPATDGEVEEAWGLISQINPGNNNVDASSYDPVDGRYRLPNLGLKSDDMEFLLESTLRDFIRQVQPKELPNFYTAPKPARNAAADILFNVGPTKFRKEYISPATGKNEGWPKFIEAFQTENWKWASEEAHRKDVGDDRNNKVKKALLEAERQKSMRKR